MTNAKRETSRAPTTGDTAAKEQLFWTLAEVLLSLDPPFFGCGGRGRRGGRRVGAGGGNGSVFRQAG